MKTNPPCYRCVSLTPLPADQIGLCSKCADEVQAEASRPSTSAFCGRCGWQFYNDWERIQHLVNQRHNYQAWTAEDGKRAIQARVTA